MTYQVINAQQKHYPVSALCRALGVSRSSYYNWRRHPESAHTRQDRALLVHIRAEHRRRRARYGSPRIHRSLRSQGIRCSRKRVERLMRQHGLRAKGRRRYKVTTDSTHRHPVAANVLNRAFDVEKPNTVWASYISYIRTHEGWVYLAVILDLYSRKVVGWALHANCRQQLTLEALEMALARRQPTAGLLHHSDRGSQYAAQAYQQRLQARGIEVSMSRRGNCWDNAPVESFFKTLKVELFHGPVFETRAEAQVAIKDYIEVFYNHERLHSTLGYLSPVAYETTQGGA